MAISFSDVGSLSSVAGLVLTIYVFFGVRKIKQEFLFRARLPSLLKNIKIHASSLSSLIQKFPETKEEIIHELSIAEVNIKSLEEKSSGSINHSLKSLRINIQNLRTTNLKSIEKSSIRDIYLQMNMVIQEITNLKEDDMWRSGNG